jgi:RNA polymerase sigma-70 factor, ECF subfamily
MTARLQGKDTMNLSEPKEAADDEAQLIATAAAGSAHAFTQLFNRYYPMIHAFAYRLSLCPAEAGDIAQDTFIQAARALGGFRREASFKNWLYTIAANKSRDRYRQHTRRVKLTEDYATLNAGSAAEPEPAQAAAVREALAGLPLEMREAVTLVYYEGLNHAEAARILGCAETTVSWRLFRAKQKLKQGLRVRSTGGAHD